MALDQMINKIKNNQELTDKDIINTVKTLKTREGIKTIEKKAKELSLEQKIAINKGIGNVLKNTFQATEEMIRQAIGENLNDLRTPTQRKIVGICALYQLINKNGKGDFENVKKQKDKITSEILQNTTTTAENQTESTNNTLESSNTVETVLDYSVDYSTIAPLKQDDISIIKKVDTNTTTYQIISNNSSANFPAQQIDLTKPGKQTIGQPLKIGDKSYEIAYQVDATTKSIKLFAKEKTTTTDSPTIETPTFTAGGLELKEATAADKTTLQASVNGKTAKGPDGITDVTFTSQENIVQTNDNNNPPKVTSYVEKDGNYYEIKTNNNGVTTLEYNDGVTNEVKKQKEQIKLEKNTIAEINDATLTTLKTEINAKKDGEKYVDKIYLGQKVRIINDGSQGYIGQTDKHLDPAIKINLAKLQEDWQNPGKLFDPTLSLDQFMQLTMANEISHLQSESEADSRKAELEKEAQLGLTCSTKTLLRDGLSSFDSKKNRDSGYESIGNNTQVFVGYEKSYNYIVSAYNDVIKPNSQITNKLNINEAERIVNTLTQTQVTDIRNRYISLVNGDQNVASLRKNSNPVYTEKINNTPTSLETKASNAVNELLKNEKGKEVYKKLINYLEPHFENMISNILSAWKKHSNDKNPFGMIRAMNTGREMITTNDAFDVSKLETHRNNENVQFLLAFAHSSHQMIYKFKSKLNDLINSEGDATTKQNLLNLQNAFNSQNKEINDLLCKDHLTDEEAAKLVCHKESRGSSFELLRNTQENTNNIDNNLTQVANPTPRQIAHQSLGNTPRKIFEFSKNFYDTEASKCSELANNLGKQNTTMEAAQKSLAEIQATMKVFTIPNTKPAQLFYFHPKQLLEKGYINTLTDTTINPNKDQLLREEIGKFRDKKQGAITALSISDLINDLYKNPNFHILDHQDKKDYRDESDEMQKGLLESFAKNTPPTIDAKKTPLIKEGDLSQHLTGTPSEVATQLKKITEQSPLLSNSTALQAIDASNQANAFYKLKINNEIHYIAKADYQQLAGLDKQGNEKLGKKEKRQGQISMGNEAGKNKIQENGSLLTDDLKLFQQKFDLTEILKTHTIDYAIVTKKNPQGYNYQERIPNTILLKNREDQKNNIAIQWDANNNYTIKLQYSAHTIKTSPESLNQDLLRAVRFTNLYKKAYDRRKNNTTLRTDTQTHQLNFLGTYAEQLITGTAKTGKESTSNKANNGLSKDIDFSKGGITLDNFTITQPSDNQPVDKFLEFIPPTTTS